MDFSHYAILLLILGLCFLVAEVFLPSGGMITLAAILCFAVSIWCGWKAWWVTGHRGLWWTYVFSFVILMPTAIGVALYVFPRTSFGKRILLEAPAADELTPYAQEQQHLAEMIGKRGETLTLMTPGGLARIEDERVHCESEGMMVDPGQPVEVVAVKGNRLVVRVISEAGGETKGPSPEPRSETELADESPLDFDVPQS